VAGVAHECAECIPEQEVAARPVSSPRETSRACGPSVGLVVGRCPDRPTERLHKPCGTYHGPESPVIAGVRFEVLPRLPDTV
jgi:hypothetical protein